MTAHEPRAHLPIRSKILTLNSGGLRVLLGPDPSTNNAHVLPLDPSEANKTSDNAWPTTPA